MVVCGVVLVIGNMCRTGVCRFGIGNWIFLLATLHLFTFVQGGDEMTEEPRDVLAVSGARVLLSCGARPSPSPQPPGTLGALHAQPAVQWRHSSRAPLTPDHAIHASDMLRQQLPNGSLVIRALSPSTAGLYQCAAGGAGRVLLGRQARVAIAELPAFAPAPAVVAATGGGPALLPCALQGPPHAPPAPSAPPRRKHKGGAPPQLQLNITWLKNNSPVLLDARTALTASGALEIDPPRHMDSGQYRCRVALLQAPEQYQTSEPIELRVDTDVASAEYAPRFVATPRATTALEGSSVTMECAAAGSPRPEVVWLHNGVAIDLSDLDSRYSLSGAGSLLVSGVRAGDAGVYTCRAYNALDTADHTAALTVLTAPRVSVPTATVVARARGVVTLRCSVSGHPPPGVVWFKDGEPITPNEHDIALVDGSSLRIQGVLPLDEGVFQCAAESVAGYSIAAITLTVRADEPAAPATKPTTSKSSAYNTKSKSSAYSKASKNVPTHMNSTQDILNSLISSAILTEDSLEPDALEPDDLDLGETSSAYTQTPEVQYGKTHHSGPQSGNSDNSLDEFYEDGFYDDLKLESLVQANASTLSPPRDLHAALVKPRFVTLSWSDPEVARVEVTAYVLLYKVTGSQRERMWSTGGAQRGVNVASLQPNTTYSFSAVAVSQRCASQPSAVIEVRTPPEEVTFGPPLSVRAAATGPHTVVISWEPPQHAQPDKYTVYYTELESGREQIQWVEPLPSSTLSTTLTNLKAGSQYRLQVAAAGGALSAHVAVSTPGAPPSAPPHNVRVDPHRDSMLVSWEAPPARSHRAPLTGYSVRYRPQDGSTREQSVTTPADVTSVTLKQLQTGVSYQIRVCALNANGSGPYSAAVVAMPRDHTRDSAPARSVPPQPPKLTTRSGRDWISVWWADPPGPSPAPATAPRSYTLGWGLGVPDDRTVDLPPHSRSYVIKNLEPNSEYVISLRAGNPVGLGPPVYATVRTKAAALEGDDIEEEEGDDDEGEEEEEEPPLIPPVGVKVIMLSGSTAVVYWSDPTLAKGQGQGLAAADERRYVVRWAANNARANTFNATDLNAMIDDLKPFTTYEFAVRLIKGGRSSPWSMLVTNTTLEAAPSSAPRELRAAPPPPPANPARSVDLAWAAPAKANGIITGYVIMYAVSPGEEWSAVTSSGAATRARVDRLRPRTAYQFKVQARNSKGLGPVSAAVQYTTAVESGDGAGLAAATSAWLWASAGGALAVLALGAALALSLCWSRATPPTPPPTSTYQKSSASAGIKPPDLWIHHDQMELRHTDKTLRDSHISVGSTEGALASSSLTLGRGEYDPPRRAHHSLDTRTYVPTYVESGSCAGSEDTALLRATPSSGTYYRCDYGHRPMTGVGVGMSVGCSSTCERRAQHRPMHIDQSTPLLSAVCPYSPQPALVSLQPPPPPPPAPCGSGSCPLGAACGGGGGGAGGGGGDVYASVARERGQYVAYEPAPLYTHRDSLSSEGMCGSGSGTLGSSGGPAVAGGPPCGPPGPAGSLTRRAGPLHSFSDHSDHSTPTHSNRSVRESSPYKKSNSSSPGRGHNRLLLGGGVSHEACEVAALSPSPSSERLQREMVNLEGLMKDLSAITQHQFQC